MFSSDDGLAPWERAQRDTPWLLKLVDWGVRAAWSLNLITLPRTVAEAEALAVKAAGGNARDFGPDDGFREGLQLLLDTLHSMPLTGNGLLWWRDVIVHGLAARLHIERVIALHPAILDAPLLLPLIVLGLPRSGTTFVQRLLSSDPHCMPLLTWQVAMPQGICPSERDLNNLPSWREARVRACAADIEMRNKLAPGVQYGHAMYADAADEEVFLLHCTTMQSLLPTAMLPCDAYLRFVLEGKNMPAVYATLRRQLLVLQWLEQETERQQQQQQQQQQPSTASPGRTPRVPFAQRTHWILKAPHHSAFLPALLQALPEARFVVLQRDPLPALLSLCGLAANVFPLTVPQVHAEHVGPCMVSMCETMLQRENGFRDAHRELAAHFLDVAFEDAVRAPLDVLRRVLAFASLPCDESTLAAAQHWLNESPEQAKHKEAVAKFVYRFEEFGLDEATLRERFQRVMARDQKA